MSKISNQSSFSKAAKANTHKSSSQDVLAKRQKFSMVQENRRSEDPNLSNSKNKGREEAKSPEKAEFNRTLTSAMHLEMASIEEASNSSTSNSDIDSMTVSEFSKYSRKRFLTISTQRRDSIKHMQKLRRVHDTKLKLQKKMIKNIADDLTENRTSLLKSMFEREMSTFLSQYSKILEVANNLVSNEEIFLKVSNSSKVTMKLSLLKVTYLNL